MIMQTKQNIKRRLRKSVNEWKPRIQKRFLRGKFDLPEVGLQAVASDGIEVLPPILDDICLPPHHGPKDHDDYAPLMSIVRSRQPSIVLELGTAHGNTVANICHQCPKTKVYTVNALSEQQTGDTITYSLKKEQIGRVYRTHGFQNRVVQIYSNTMELDLSEYFKSPVVDLAIIDACHDCQYVLHDFLNVHPFICPGGVVLLHDTHPDLPPNHIGSYIACMMLRKRGYDIRRIENTWWGFWINS